jgi:hypothetical protein
MSGVKKCEIGKGEFGLLGRNNGDGRKLGCGGTVVVEGRCTASESLIDIDVYVQCTQTTVIGSEMGAG